MTFNIPDSSVTIVAAYEFTAENNVVPSGDSSSTILWIIAIVISSFALLSAAYTFKKKTHRH